VKRRLREDMEPPAGGDAPPAPPCWLCEGVGTVAVHGEASAQLGITLWMPFRPGSPAHPTRQCPACLLRNAGGLLDESRQIIERMAGLINW